MTKFIFAVFAACVAFVGSSHAQEMIIDRPTGFAINDANGVLAGESNRFGDFAGFYPADHFVLKQPTTLESFTAFGSTFIPSTFPTDSLEGVTVQIFNDVDGIPDGNAFADVFTGGNYGSEGIVYLPAVELGNGLQLPVNGGGVCNIRINFTQANGGEPITLPAGEYWITLAPRTPSWHPGDPTGRWKWQSSATPFSAERLVMSRNQSGSTLKVWEPICFPDIGETFAWQLTGESFTLLGDINLDGVVNLLDVGPFVALLSNGQFQAEADINQDETVNLLDVAGFVDLIAGN